MINTKELRLGNLFANIEDDSIYKVTKINEDTIEGICINNMGWFGEQHFHLIEQVLPIRITEEWLLKFGFEKKGDFWFVKSGIKIENRNNGFSYFRYLSEIKILSVHQLQNLYFALTGEELMQVSEGKN